jgi:DUF971 family protein
MTYGFERECDLRPLSRIPGHCLAYFPQAWDATCTRFVCTARALGPEPMTNSDTEHGQKAWPTEVRLRKDRAILVITFDNGETAELTAEYLRVRSPSAEVQGHSPSERKTVARKRNVKILEVHPVGNYAVRLVFDDMHSTGIFSWDYLLELNHNRDANWQDYLDDLAAKGLSRD